MATQSQLSLELVNEKKNYRISPAREPGNLFSAIFKNAAFLFFEKKSDDTCHGCIGCSKVRQQETKGRKKTIVVVLLAVKKQEIYLIRTALPFLVINSPCQVSPCAIHT